jgi:hypothetical protein
VDFKGLAWVGVQRGTSISGSNGQKERYSIEMKTLDGHMQKCAACAPLYRDKFALRIGFFPPVCELSSRKNKKPPLQIHFRADKREINA